MSDSVTYYMDNSYLESPKEDKELSQDVINIRELFRLLSFEDKALAKRLLREEPIF